MDWRAAAVTFGAVFLAEVADKTQITIVALGGRTPSRFSVWLGATLALATTSALAVFAGGLLGRAFSPRTLRLVTGLALVGLGAAVLLWPARNEG